MANSRQTRLLGSIQWSFAFSLLGAFAIVALGGCDSSAPVKYILPTSYRGAFVIRVDAINGSTMKEKSGWIHVRVPRNGIILVKNTDFLQRWHSWRAEFENHIPIPDAGNAKELLAYSDDKECLLKQVCFETIGTESDGSTYFYVGPLREIIKFERKGLLHAAVGDRSTSTTTMPTTAKDKSLPGSRME